MVNVNYRRGRAKEYRLMNKFKKRGCSIVFRSAGSHSPIDVIAINKEKKTIYFIQSKPKKFSKNKKEELLIKHNELSGKFDVVFGVI